eukprot:Rhum_TRINITY_DN14468_c5_g1::Rhum_TRINITY_DN14468_c5_g1_i1::g.89764::m.89764
MKERRRKRQRSMSVRRDVQRRPTVRAPSEVVREHRVRTDGTPHGVTDAPTAAPPVPDAWPHGRHTRHLSGSGDGSHRRRRQRRRTTTAPRGTAAVRAEVRVHGQLRLAHLAGLPRQRRRQLLPAVDAERRVRRDAAAAVHTLRVAPGRLPPHGGRLALAHAQARVLDGRVVGGQPAREPVHPVLELLHLALVQLPQHLLPLRRRRSHDVLAAARPLRASAAAAAEHVRRRLAGDDALERRRGHRPRVQVPQALRVGSVPSGEGRRRWRRRRRTRAEEGVLALPLRTRPLVRVDVHDAATARCLRLPHGRLVLVHVVVLEGVEGRRHRGPRRQRRRLLLLSPACLAAVGVDVHHLRVRRLLPRSPLALHACAAGRPRADRSRSRRRRRRRGGRRRRGRRRLLLLLPPQPPLLPAFLGRLLSVQQPLQLHAQPLLLRTLLRQLLRLLAEQALLLLEDGRRRGAAAAAAAFFLGLAAAAGSRRRRVAFATGHNVQLADRQGRTQRAARRRCRIVLAAAAAGGGG